MTFKIGDNIIMTADNGKGLIFTGYKNGDICKGVVTYVHEDGGVSITLVNERIYSFENNGIGSGYPGMSIRPVKERTEQNDALDALRYAQQFVDIGNHKPTTPSQWIEGQMPDDYRGWLWIWRHLYSDPTTAKLVYSGDTIQVKREQYSHWMPAELPPPPPAKEVEAFGILEWLKYEPRGRTVDEITKATAFYSQPATAENKEKYLYIKPEFDGDEWESHPDMTLDEFIAYWGKKLRDNHKKAMAFTPAALDMLGVK